MHISILPSPTADLLEVQQVLYKGFRIILEYFELIGKIQDFEENKTISDGGITVDFSIIKVHTSN